MSERTTQISEILPEKQETSGISGDEDAGMIEECGMENGDCEMRTDAARIPVGDVGSFN